MIDDLPLFAATLRPPVNESAPPDTALTLLDALDPDAMTPREALEALYKLKGERATVRARKKP